MGEAINDELARRQLCTCTVCKAAVNVCTTCRLSLLFGQVVRCRGGDGHDHATCAAARVRRVLPPRESGSTAPAPSTQPPPSSARRRGE